MDGSARRHNVLIVANRRMLSTVNARPSRSLRGSMVDADADSLAGALRPVLDAIDPADREEFVGLAIRALEILAKGKKRRRR